MLPSALRLWMRESGRSGVEATMLKRACPAAMLAMRSVLMEVYVIVTSDSLKS